MRISDWSSDVCSSDLLDLWSRLVGKTRFASLPQRLVRYRSHTGAVSVRRAQTQRGVVLAVRTRLASNLLGTEVTPADVAALEAALTGSGDAKGLAFARDLLEIGRASCRERVCQSV